MKIWTLILLALALVFSISATYPHRAVMYFKGIDWTAARVLEAAKSDAVIIPMDEVFTVSGHRHGALDTLVLANPNIKIIGYLLNLHVVTPWWGLHPSDSAAIQHDMPFNWEYQHLLRQYWVYTVAGDGLRGAAGDTAMIWLDSPLINPIASGTVNRAMISKIVRCIKKYRDTAGYKLDGVFWDYAMTGFTLLPQAKCSGYLDFDGNGTVYDSDAAERALVKQYQLELFDSVRIVLGNDFIQLQSGTPAQSNAEFAIRANGINWENFPYEFGQNGTNHRALFARFLAVQNNVGWQTPCLCKNWSLVSFDETNTPENIIASLIGLCMYGEKNPTLWLGWNTWPGLNPGIPTGPAITTIGTSPVTYTYTRAYTRGIARLIYNSGGTITTAEFDSTGH